MQLSSRSALPGRSCLATISHRPRPSCLPIRPVHGRVAHCPPPCAEAGEGNGKPSTGTSTLTAERRLNSFGNSGGLDSVSMSSMDGAFFGEVSTDGKGHKYIFSNKDLCLYKFNDKQVHALEHLRDNMTSCSNAFFILAAANVAMSFQQIEEEHLTGPAMLVAGLSVGDVAYWADSIMVAALLRYAVGPFSQVLEEERGQLANTFRGLNRIGLIFQQLTIGSLAVGTVTLLEAAVTYPPLVVGASGLFFGIAVLRSFLLWYVLSRHGDDAELEAEQDLMSFRSPSKYNKMSLMDRLAITLAFGYILEYGTREQARMNASLTSASSAMTASSGALAAAAAHVEVEKHVQFGLPEERLLRIIIESTSNAGTALAMQAFAVFLLVVGQFAVEDYSAGVSNGINIVNKAIAAVLLFRAATTFDRALHIDHGDDVEHLVEGLSEEGLGELFKSLGVLSWALAIAGVVGVLLPVVEESPLYSGLSDVLSHRGADMLLEGAQWLTRIIRAL